MLLRASFQVKISAGRLWLSRSSGNASLARDYGFLARKIYAVGLLPASSDSEKTVFFR
jgi:hypothetical protein